MIANSYAMGDVAKVIYNPECLLSSATIDFIYDKAGQMTVSCSHTISNQ